MKNKKMDWKLFMASAGAGICLGTGALAILKGYYVLGIPLILLWILNMWILFKPVKELLRVTIASAGVSVSIGLSMYAMFINQKLFALVILAIGLANLLYLVKEVKEQY